MASEVKIPELGESISSGILAAWHVKDGEYVEKDQIIYELETDKITSEGVADVAGKISLKVDEGDEVDVGQVVADIDESAEPSDSEDDKDDKKEEKEKEKESKKSDKSEAKKEEKEEEEEEDKEEEKEEKGGEKEEAEEKEKAEEKEREEDKKPARDQENGRQPLSPAVRRLASESGIDPSEVSGSGKGGRVTKGDMLEEIEKQKRSRQKEEGKPSAPAEKGERTTRRRMSSLRQRIAQRLVAAQQEAAMLTTFNEVDMSAVQALRSKYQESFVKKHDIKLGFMSFFVKAVVRALKEVPGLNAQIDGDEIVQNHFYDIGIAVSTEKGLLVPVVRNCDQLSLAEIEKEIISYANKAREGKIKIDDLQGGVFSITNGGVFGSLLSTPILNAPQSGILGMHKIQDRPVAVEGKVEIRPMMYVAVSYDHRIVDGREAVTFLVKVKEGIEDPTRLVIDV